MVYLKPMLPFKATLYFHATRERGDRQEISPDWIARAMTHSHHQQTQPDGRIRRWAPVPEAQGRMLRVVLLPDGGTVHNDFVDRSFKP